MSNKDRPVKWADHYDVLHEDDIPGLEMQAAIHEFADKMPRSEAEKKAYAAYNRDRMLDSAAHHLQGIRTATGAGNTHAAEQHGALYATAMAASGLSATDAPPPEIVDRIHGQDQHNYNFTPHRADSLHAAESEPNEEEMDKSEDYVSILTKMKTVLRHLR